MKRKSHLSKQKRQKILECFAAVLSATQTAKVLSLNRNAVNLWYKNFQEQILEKVETSPTKKLSGEIELDESYFGGLIKKQHAEDRRKRGRGAESKVPIFVVLKRYGKVYTQIIKNASKQELMPIVKHIVRKQSTIYTDKSKVYDGLVFDGYKHKRINHSRICSNRKSLHINGIENFWSFAKRRLAKFNGVNRRAFLLHLK